MRHLKATTAEASLKAAFVFDMVGARAAKMDRMVLPLLNLTRRIRQISRSRRIGGWWRLNPEMARRVAQVAAV